jgi:hypothetical protein
MTLPTAISLSKEAGKHLSTSVYSSLSYSQTKGGNCSSTNSMSDNDQTPLVKGQVTPTPRHEKEKGIGEGLFGFGPM